MPLSAAQGPLASAAVSVTSAAWPAAHRLTLPRSIGAWEMPTGSHGDALCPRALPGTGTRLLVLVHQAVLPEWRG